MVAARRGALLGILEILVPGIFLVWMAVAAGITGLDRRDRADAARLAARHLRRARLRRGLSGRGVYARNPVASGDPKLNDRAARLIGQIVTVESAIENGKGRVKVGDGVWNAPRAGRAERGEGAGGRGGRDLLDGGGGVRLRSRG